MCTIDRSLDEDTVSKSLVCQFDYDRIILFYRGRFSAVKKQKTKNKKQKKLIIIINVPSVPIIPLKVFSLEILCPKQKGPKFWKLKYVSPF